MNITYGGSLPQIEKLRGSENYEQWKMDVEMYLLHEDLWDYVEAEVATDATTHDRKQSQRARAKIYLLLDQGPKMQVTECKTSKAMWNKLQEIYEDKGINRLVSLIDQLFEIHLETCTSMEDYVQRFSTVDAKLKSIGKAIDDELLAVLMLRGLTLDYRPFRMALENTITGAIKSDLVKQRLLQEGHKRAAESREEQVAFNTKQRYRHQGEHQGGNSSTSAPGRSTSEGKGKWKKSTFDPKKARCHKCGVIGHIKSQCKEERTNRYEGSGQGSSAPKQGHLTTWLTALRCEVSSEKWYIDSGANAHMARNRDCFTTFRSDSSSGDVTVANNSEMNVTGIGDVQVDLEQGNSVIVSNVLHVPGLATSLLSVNRLVEKGTAVLFDSYGCRMYDAKTMKIRGVIQATGTKENGIYSLDVKQGNSNNVFDNNGTVGFSADIKNINSQLLWHKRLGHLGHKNMQMLKGLVNGVNYSVDEVFHPCESCVKGKHVKRPFTAGPRIERMSEKLSLVHSDLCGPMDPAGIRGELYMLTFIDDCTRKVFAFFLKSKESHVILECFRTFKARVENETGNRIKCLRTDNGNEYMGQALQRELRSSGIKHETTIPYNPEQNGLAERANRVIIERARSMLFECNLPKCYWVEACRTAVYLKNRAPARGIGNALPEERWTGHKIDLSHLRVFGCIAYGHVAKQLRKKLDATSQQYHFVGYCEDSKGYFLADPRNVGKIVKARDVVFFEDRFKESQPSESVFRHSIILPSFSGSSEGVTPKPQPEVEASVNEAIDISVSSSEGLEEDSEYSVQTVESGSDSQGMEIIDHGEERRYPLRHRVPKEFPDHVLFLTSINSACNQPLSSYSDPQTVEEALSSNGDGWRKAMQLEWEALTKKGVLSLVDLPEGKKPIKCKWVFKQKVNAAGELERFRARLVAKGFSQKYGVDYFETFSPVISYPALRLLIALSVELDLNITHLDVTAAFLNCDLKETIYMEQPEGFVMKGAEGKVCRLHKAIYGLKQASKSWYDKCHSVFKSFGFVNLTTESCIYVKGDGHTLCVVAIYVDDFLVFCKDNDVVVQLVAFLKKHFEIRNLGEAKSVLGMRLTRTSEGIELDQEEYIKNMLAKFNMLDANSASTPMEAGLDINPGDPVKCPNVPYQVLIGCLMYAMTCTRPDIAYAVSKLSRYNNNFTMEHWTYAKRVLRYLKGTLNFRLIYVKSGKFLEGYADADFANDKIDRVSCTGYVFKFAGGAVAWESKKQPCVALSTTEAEYVSLSACAKKGIVLSKILKEILKKHCKRLFGRESVCLYNDNQSAVKNANGVDVKEKSKHIDVRFHFVKAAVAEGKVVVDFKSTKEMIADVLTKSLTKYKHFCCVKGMNLLCN